ncbi:MAG: glycosyltransferase [Opitutales bacterium]|nr:glycosyltransferase [Opitutales bacterium]
MKQQDRFYLSADLALPSRNKRVEGLPLVSIVTPSFQYGHFIERTIRSILAQTYPNIEYIIIDGGSTDDTVAVIKKYENAGISQWISEPDNGQTDAINKGFSMCSGDLFAWLNADDAYAYPEVIEEVVDAYTKGARFISGEWEAWDGDGNLYSEGRKWGQSDPVVYEDLLKFWEHICPPQPATFVDRKIAEDVFPLDTSVQCFMDFQLFLGVLAQNPKCKWSHNRWADFVYHGANKSLGNYAERFDLVGEHEATFLCSAKANLPERRFKSYSRRFYGQLAFLRSRRSGEPANFIDLIYSHPVLLADPLFGKTLLRKLMGSRLYQNVKRACKLFVFTNNPK